MPELHGAQLPSDGLHVAIRYDVPDQPSRDALVLTPDDVGALLLQRDVSSIFALVSVTPVTWSQIPDGESTLQAIIAINALVNERVVGPAASNDNAVPVFDGTTGKLLKESLATIDSLGNLATPGTVDGVDVSDFHAATFVTASAGSGLPNERVLTAGVGISLTPGAGILTIDNTAAGASAVQGPAGATDTAIALFDGSTGALIKESLARVDNLGNITTPGTVDGVDVSNLALAVALVAVPDYVTLSSTPTLGNERTLTAGAGITITDDGPGGAVTVTSTGGAPVGASYVTLGANATLTSERVLTAGTNITITDGGAGGPVTIASTGGGGGAPTDAEYLVSTANAGLSAERVLTAGSGVTLTPAAGTLTVATPSAVQGPASAVDNQITRYDGTTGKLVQAGASTPSIDDSGNIVMVGAATVDGVDVSALVVPSYLTLGATATLSNERTLTAGTGITFADGGAGGALTINNTVTGDVVGPAGAPATSIARYNGSTGKIITSTGVTIDSSNNMAGLAQLTMTGNVIMSTAGATVDGVDLTALTAVPFITTATSTSLTSERVLTAGAGITLTDGGAGGALTVAATGGGGAPTTAQYLTLATDATLTAERVLTAGTGISFVDGGAGGALTITSTAGVSGTHAAIARSTGGQAVSAATNTVVILATEESDVGNNFAANTYTVPVTGLYQINMSCTVNGTAVAGVLYLGLNGAAVVGTGFGVAYGGFINAALSLVRPLTAGNTITMIVQIQTATTVGGGQLDVHRIA